MNFRVSRGSLQSWRVYFFFIIIFLCVGFTAYRFFSLTVFDHLKFSQIAEKQYLNQSNGIAGRGNVYFSNIKSGDRVIAATNKRVFYAYSNKSRSISESSKDALARLSKTDRSTIDSRIASNKDYQVLIDDLDDAQLEQLKAFNLSDVTTASEVRRYYPGVSLAANVLGFVGFDELRRAGQYGIEGFYDALLSATKDNKSGKKSYFSSIFSFFQNNEDESSTDNKTTTRDLVLTIDPNIQGVIEDKLNGLLKKWRAESGSIIVQDPKTGELLAMASSPSFDPNSYSLYPLTSYTNTNVQEIYEPGSTFKGITMAAAIDKNAVTPDTRYEDAGEVKIDEYTIKNFDGKAHGSISMREVLEKSLNTGTIFAENRLGDDNFLNYIVAFGFGQKTGVGLVGEVAGNISNLYNSRKINFLTASFGQGIAVSPLQLINAYSAIANGGVLMQPHIVKEIVNFDGSTERIEPKVLGRPISEKTSLTLRNMLVDVVERGFDHARVPGYKVAGKTGTAQIPDINGGYLGNDQFIHNFIGFAPAMDPQFVILIKMVKPKGITFAADSLSPTFAEITRFMLHYLNIPPTK